MKSRFALACLFSIFPLGSCFAFDEIPGLVYKEKYPLSVAGHKALDRALAIFRAQGIDWKVYKFMVEENDNSFRVMFWKPEDEVVERGDLFFRDGARIFNHEVPGGEVTVINHREPFRVTLHKWDGSAVWNSLDGDRF